MSASFNQFSRLVWIAPFLAILALAVASSPVQAREQGPKLGEKIPHQLNSQDQYGKARDFPSLGGKRGLILLFTKSLDW